MMKEQNIQTKMIKFLEKENWNVVKTIVLSKSGYPDIFAFKNGVTVFIEVKRKGMLAKELQGYRLRKFREDNFKAECFDNFNDFKKWYMEEINL